MLTFRDILFIGLGDALGFLLVSCVRMIIMGHVRVVHIGQLKDFEGEEDD